MAQGSTGGFADGSAPRVVYGEIGKREYYIVPERKDNLPLLAGAASDMGYGLTEMARGGRIGAEREGKKQATPAHRRADDKMRRKLRPEQRGEGQPPRGPMEGFGPSMYTLIPEARRVAEAVANRHGTPWNTYSNHPPGFAQPYFRERSIDWWGSPGRGTPIGDAWGGVSNDAASRMGGNLDWILNPGNDPAHWDHVHVTGWTGQGGEGTPDFQPMRTLFDAAWNKFVQPMVDRFIDPLKNSNSLAPKLAGSAAGKIPPAIKEWAYEQMPIGDAPGTLQPGAAANLTIGKALQQGGWPGDLVTPASGIVWRESRGNARAQNPSGARGLMQIMPQTAAGVGANYGQLYDPVYNTSTGWRVYQQAGGFAPWVAPPGGDYTNEPVYGYEKGGLIPGRPGEEKQILAHAGEIVLPRGVSDAFLRFSKSLVSVAPAFESSTGLTGTRSTIAGGPSTAGGGVPGVTGQPTGGAGQRGVQSARSATTATSTASSGGGDPVEKIIANDNANTAKMVANSRGIALEDRQVSRTNNTLLNQNVKTQGTLSRTAQRTQTTSLSTKMASEGMRGRSQNSANTGRVLAGMGQQSIRQDQQAGRITQQVMQSGLGTSRTVLQSGMQVGRQVVANAQRVGQAVMQNAQQIMSTTRPLQSGVERNAQTTQELLAVERKAWGLARGGIVKHPTRARLGEGGKKEAVIPLEAHRSRARKLWEEAGRELGAIPVHGAGRHAAQGVPGKKQAAGGDGAGLGQGWSLTRNNLMTYTLGAGNHAWMTEMINRYNASGTLHMLPHYSGGAMARITEGAAGGNAGLTSSTGSIEVNPYHLAQGVPNFDNYLLMHELGHGAGLPHMGSGLMVPWGNWGGGNEENLGSVIGMLRSAYGTSGRPRAPVMQAGGVVPGKGPQPALLHGGERVLPVRATRAFEKLADAILKWSRATGSSGSVGGGSAGPGTDGGGGGTSGDPFSSQIGMLYSQVPKWTPPPEATETASPVDESIEENTEETAKNTESIAKGWKGFARDLVRELLGREKKEKGSGTGTGKGTGKGAGTSDSSSQSMSGRSGKQKSSGGSRSRSTETETPATFEHSQKQHGDGRMIYRQEDTGSQNARNSGSKTGTGGGGTKTGSGTGKGSGTGGACDCANGDTGTKGGKGTKSGGGSNSGTGTASGKSFDDRQVTHDEKAVLNQRSSGDNGQVNRQSQDQQGGSGRQRMVQGGESEVVRRENEKNRSQSKKENGEVVGAIKQLGDRIEKSNQKERPIDRSLRELARALHRTAGGANPEAVKKSMKDMDGKALFAGWKS
jgi:hypothetical protein